MARSFRSSKRDNKQLWRCSRRNQRQPGLLKWAAS